MKNPTFDLEEFSRVNIARCDNPDGFNVADKAPTYFGSGIMEEAGEVGGILKKLERGFNLRELSKLKEKRIKAWEKSYPNSPHAFEELSYTEWEDMWKRNRQSELALELADLFTMMDIVCTKYDINLFGAVKGKFNHVSEQMQCTQYNIQDKDGKN